MIEVMFGESEGGAMKMAKAYKKPDFHNGTMAFIGGRPSKEEFDKMFDGKAVGGNSSEVVCLPLMLDIGDITVTVENEYRKKLIYDMYTIHGMDNMDISEFNHIWERYLKEIERLKHYAAKGETLRLWYSDAPYSICGFYYACNLLRKYNCKVFAIKLPQFMQQEDDAMEFYSSWGEIPAGKFYKFLHLEKELSFCEIRSFATNWDELRKERSSLREVVNGKVIGVPEDFYDHVIRKELLEGEFMMGSLIGNILGRHPLGISDWWYAKRIIKMIEQGELVVVQKKKEIYSQVLKKS